MQDLRPIIKIISMALPKDRGFLFLTFPTDQSLETHMQLASTIGTDQTIEMLTDYLERVKAKKEKKEAEKKEETKQGDN